MSESTDPGTAPAVPEPPAPAADPAPQSEPQPEETNQPAAEAEGDKAEGERQTKLDRRLATLRAQLTAAQQRIDDMERRGLQPPEQPETPLTPEQQAAVDRAIARGLAERETKARVERFHEAGRAAHADWAARCKSLMDMGADGGLAEILVDLPDGARVAGALADDPEALEKIAGLRTERARAIALGKYAAAFEAEARPTQPRVTRAPAPIRPVNGSTARAEFNPYLAGNSADGNAALTAYYTERARKARGL
jgi:hypothetical protein